MDKNINPIIKQFAKENKESFNKILKCIKKYDRIAIFRHIMPDYDALGTQVGLAIWIKDNFPSKEVRVLGDNHVTFTPRIFKEMDSLNEEWFKKPFLAIIVDVSNISRIADPRFKKSRCKVKIDHHPAVENFAKISVVNTSSAAASEIVAAMLLTFKGDYKLSEEAAKNLYIALVGDSGRFQYSSTTPLTFAVAQELLKTGIDISSIYQTMYLKNIEDLKVTAYVLNHFSVSPHGVAYYVLPKDIQDELHITTERGKENVNIFANIDGINAWCSVTEDPKDNCFRVSIRSKRVPINDVATRFAGGGHAQASGAKIKTLDELPNLINALDELFIK